MSSRVKITFPHYLYGKSRASKEINLTKLMGEKNIGRKVHGSTKGFWKSTMSMNKMNGSVFNMVERNIELTKGDMKKIIRLVLKMHKEGYYHGSIHRKNIVWKQLEDDKNFKLRHFRYTGKTKNKLDYKFALSEIKSRTSDELYEQTLHSSIMHGDDRMKRVENTKDGDLISLFLLLQNIYLVQNERKLGNNNRNNNRDVNYDAMKYTEHLYKFSKWFRETVETEVKNLNNKNKKNNFASIK